MLAELPPALSAMAGAAAAAEAPPAAVESRCASPPPAHAATTRITGIASARTLASEEYRCIVEQWRGVRGTPRRLPARHAGVAREGIGRAACRRTRRLAGRRGLTGRRAAGTAAP